MLLSLSDSSWVSEGRYCAHCGIPGHVLAAVLCNLAALLLPLGILLVAAPEV